VCCAWFDEFSPLAGEHADADSFLEQHQAFVEQRLRKLERAQADDNRRKAQIRSLNISQGLAEPERFQVFAECLSEQIIELHQAHAQIDPVTGKQLSIGL